MGGQGVSRIPDDDPQLVVTNFWLLQFFLLQNNGVFRVLFVIQNGYVFYVTNKNLVPIVIYLLLDGYCSLISDTLSCSLC